MATYPSGIAFPFRFRASGGVAKVSAGQKISANLMALITSSVKERLIRKEVGTVGFHRVLRSAHNNTGLVESLVLEAITRFEPRAKDVQVNVFPQEYEEGEMRVYVEISFIFKYSSDPVILRTRIQ